MSKLIEFFDEFKTRHDFDLDELNILRERHDFLSCTDNIPVAWIVPIDEMCCQFKYENVSNIKIDQIFGNIVIQFKPEEYKEKYNPIIELLNKKISNIDKDLYLKL
jgi:hypothetical protein